MAEVSGFGIRDLDGGDAAYREAWLEREGTVHSRRRAASGLAWVELGRHNHSVAEDWARTSVALAVEIESASAQFHSREVLISVLAAIGSPAALPEAAVFLKWGRRLAADDCRFELCRGLITVRLATARVALGRAFDCKSPQSAIPPTDGASHQAARHLRSAAYWIERGRQHALRVDEQGGVHRRRRELQELADQLDLIRASMAS